MLEGALAVCQVEVQGEVEPLEEPCLVAEVGHILMGRPCKQEMQRSNFKVLLS